MNAYRFSISWSRVLPDGLVSNVNAEGVQYYNNLINGLIDAGIKPMVTMYHWDLPSNLETKFGGWLNESMTDYFKDYADFLYNNFGDRVIFRSLILFYELFFENYQMMMFIFLGGRGIICLLQLSPTIGPLHCQLPHLYNFICK